MAQSQPGQIRISLLATLDNSATVLFGLYELFAGVGTVWPMLMGEDDPGAAFTVEIVARSKTPFRCHTGVMIEPHATFGERRHTDVVMVPDVVLHPDDDPHGLWPEETAWLADQAEQGALIASVCTGSIMLAEAGLLDGLPATVHWAYHDMIARSYPKVRLMSERVLVPAGPGHMIVTAGGSSSWEDLALYVVWRFCGEAEALRTAKVFVIGDRRDGQLPFAAMNARRKHEDAAIERVQDWIAEHYAEPNPVASMVRRSGLAERTFKRRFRAATGYAPVEYVQALRIEEAKHLLETSDLSADEVAHDVGYDDPASFRRLFKRLTGITPGRYRQRVRATFSDAAE